MKTLQKISDTINKIVSYVGMVIFIVLIIALLIGAGCYTFIYIRRIRKKQNATLKAYLDLLSKQESAHQKAQQSVTEDAKLSPEDEKFMDKVMAYVERELANSDANLADMASATGTSLSGLNRKMKSLVGLTPAEFIFEVRMKKACALLTTTSMPVSDITWQCGFTDPKYFSKRFKASKGMSPTDYRMGRPVAGEFQGKVVCELCTGKISSCTHGTV